jgi:hypothetical protein
MSDELAQELVPIDRAEHKAAAHRWTRSAGWRN